MFKTWQMLTSEFLCKPIDDQLDLEISLSNLGSRSGQVACWIHFICFSVRLVQNPETSQLAGCHAIDPSLLGMYLNAIICSCGGVLHGIVSTEDVYSLVPFPPLNRQLHPNWSCLMIWWAISASSWFRMEQTEAAHVSTQPSFVSSVFGGFYGSKCTRCFDILCWIIWVLLYIQCAYLLLVQWG